MFKKLLSFALVIVTVLSCAVIFASCGEKDGGKTESKDTLKVGAILVGDETEGYTLAHMNGIDAAIKAIKEKTGKTVEVVYKKKIGEDEVCAESAEALIADDCTLIVSNSYGHQDFIKPVADKYPKISFVAMTGDFAAICGASNMHNAFTNVYESRYVSGVVAGMKLKDMIEKNEILDSNKKDGKIKIGYVGAYPYAEVVSGYTAFFLGIQSIVPEVTMEVVYTDSWFSEALEGQAAEYLMSQGCVIIGQHADSTGAPSAVQKARESGKYTNVYSVGYNVDMLTAAKDVALTSAANNWEVYYEFLFTQMLEGKEIPTDWAAGYAQNAVAITALGSACAEGTQAKVDEVVKAIKDGSLKVFDVSKFTVGGKQITEENAKIDLSYFVFTNNTPKLVYQGETKNALVTENGVTYFSESTLRAAPYFAIRIDGIVENTDKSFKKD